LRHGRHGSRKGAHEPTGDFRSACLTRAYQSARRNNWSMEVDRVMSAIVDVVASFPKNFCCESPALWTRRYTTEPLSPTRGALLSMGHSQAQPTPVGCGSLPREPSAVVKQVCPNCYCRYERSSSLISESIPACNSINSSTVQVKSNSTDYYWRCRRQKET
jgi:hypothetical protein